MHDARGITWNEIRESEKVTCAVEQVVQQRVAGEDDTSGEHQQKEDDDRTFIVEYQGKYYDIKALFPHHPGGRKTLGAYKGMSLDKILAETPHSKAAYHMFEQFMLDNQKQYEDIEKLIKWDKPMLSQVSSLGDRYWEWVNLPVLRPIRLFESNILEFLSITPWYVIPIVWIPLSVYFFYVGCAKHINSSIVNSMPGILAAFAWGVLLWTFLEYILHRKLFHYKPPADSKTLITLHFVLHGVHHKAPFDGQRLLFPPVAALLVAVVLFHIYKSIFPSIMIHITTSGTMAGYMCYDLMHYYLHYGSPTPDSYFYVMKRYHNHHHFSQHDEGFGISSRLWDYIFNTMISLRHLKKAIIW